MERECIAAISSLAVPWSVSALPSSAAYPLHSLAVERECIDALSSLAVA